MIDTLGRHPKSGIACFDVVSPDDAGDGDPQPSSVIDDG